MGATNVPTQKTLRLWGSPTGARVVGHARDVLQAEHTRLTDLMGGEAAKLNTEYRDKLRIWTSEVEQALAEGV